MALESDRTPPSSVDEGVFVSGPGRMTSASARADQTEDRGIAGKGGDLASPDTRSPGRQRLREHEATATVAEAGKVSPADHSPAGGYGDAENLPGFRDAHPGTHRRHGLTVSGLDH